MHFLKALLTTALALPLLASAYYDEGHLFARSDEGFEDLHARDETRGIFARNAAPVDYYDAETVAFLRRRADLGKRDCDTCGSPWHSPSSCPNRGWRRPQGGRKSG